MVRMVRASDASVSRAGGPLRRDGRFTRILPFGLIALLSLVLALLPAGAADADGAHPDAAIAAAVVFGAIVVAAVVFPWDRWRPSAQVLVPLAYLVTVMLVVHAEGSDGAGYTILYILPVAWLALYGTQWQLGTVMVLVTALIVLPPWVDGPLLGEQHYAYSDYLLSFVVLLIILFVGLALRLATDAASRDVLTGLPNRRAFMAALRQRPATGLGSARTLSIAMLDLDRFKAFNDTHGHEAGDRLLAATALAWSGSLRERDLLSRVGGEEFGLLVEGGLDEALGIAQRLVALGPEGQTASAGVAECAPGGDPLDALRAADMALYDAKSPGRARVVVAPG